MGHLMRLKLTLAGLLVKLANHCTTQGTLASNNISIKYIQGNRK